MNDTRPRDPFPDSPDQSDERIAWAERQLAKMTPAELAESARRGKEAIDRAIRRCTRLGFILPRGSEN